MARFGMFDVESANVGWMDRAILAGGWFAEETFPVPPPVQLAADATTVRGIIEAIKAELHSQLLFDAAPDLPILPDVVFGEKNIEVYSTRRIVFVPIRGKHKAAGALYRPSRLWYRDLSFEVHIRTESYEACDELAEDLVVAMHNCLSPDSYEMLGEDWDGDEMTGPPGQQLIILLVNICGFFGQDPPEEVQPESAPVTSEFVEVTPTSIPISS